jgi:hypothetical protein
MLHLQPLLKHILNDAPFLELASENYRRTKFLTGSHYYHFHRWGVNRACAWLVGKCGAGFEEQHLKEQGVIPNQYPRENLTGMLRRFSSRAVHIPTGPIPAENEDYIINSFAYSTH